MNNTARDTILGSIRSHLTASVPLDARELAPHHENLSVQAGLLITSNPIELFSQSLEAVDGRCIIARDDAEIAQALTQIISRLGAQRIAISDNPEVERLLQLTDLEIEELGTAPNASDIFRYDVGISGVQAAIAETGTLILDSAYELHRLVSLVPPVHIAIVNASTICQTLGEALASVSKGKEISPTITFITGPSRTADIELTLAIGVHGPQEIYVIINAAT